MSEKTTTRRQFLAATGEGEGGTERKAEGKSQKAKGKETPSLTTPKGKGVRGRRRGTR